MDVYKATGTVKKQHTDQQQHHDTEIQWFASDFIAFDNYQDLIMRDQLQEVAEQSDHQEPDREIQWFASDFVSFANYQDIQVMDKKSEKKRKNPTLDL
jgi:hypothetical protein